MSATQETARPRQRQNEAQSAEHKGNGQATGLGNVTIEIAGLEVTLPVKFAPGHVLTENQAKVLDAAYQRQFTNNQNAMAKSRATALENAKTDAEKATAQAKIDAMTTAGAIAALYADYEPSVGGTPRQSTMEKLRSDAAWRFWVGLVTQHNEHVAAGKTPVIIKAGAKPVQLPSGKGAVEKREAMSAALLALPQYAAGIQAQLDAILAERGTKAPAPAADTVVASGADLL